MQNYSQGYNQDYNQSNYNQGSYNYGNYNQYPEYGPGYSDNQAAGYNQQQSYNQQYQQVRPKTDDSLRDILTLVINVTSVWLGHIYKPCLSYHSLLRRCLDRLYIKSMMYNH